MLEILVSLTDEKGAAFSQIPAQSSHLTCFLSQTLSVPAFLLPLPILDLQTRFLSLLKSIQSPTIQILNLSDCPDPGQEGGRYVLGAVSWPSPVNVFGSNARP